MNITITARKISLNDSFKERVEKKLLKLDRFFDDDAYATVTVSAQKERETVEVTVRSKGMVFRAERTTQDMFDSLEAVVDSIFRQITTNKSKLEKRLRENAFMENSSAEQEQEFKIVKTKKFAVKPMDIEEAILQMNLVGHEFFMFRNSQSNEINVVYKRKNGDYGVIEPEHE